MSREIIDKIIKKYQTNKNFYLGEKVTIAEHMIQTAMLAEKDNSPQSLIVLVYSMTLVILLYKILIN